MTDMVSFTVTVILFVMIPFLIHLALLSCFNHLHMGMTLLIELSEFGRSLVSHEIDLSLDLGAPKYALSLSHAHTSLIILLKNYGLFFSYISWVDFVYFSLRMVDLLNMGYMVDNLLAKVN